MPQILLLMQMEIHLALDLLTKSSKATELGILVLSLAGNMIASACIRLAISKVISALYNLVYFPYFYIHC